MCTAATYQTKDFYFGRNLDYEFPYGEEVCIVPRSFPIPLRHLPALQTHYAMIGMAHVEDGFPLFYDAVNEMGLCIAGLNFVGNAAYAEPTDGKTNVAQLADRVASRHVPESGAGAPGACRLQSRRNAVFRKASHRAAALADCRRDGRYRARKHGRRTSPL